MSGSGRPLRIGGASGFWGDSRWGPEHLVRQGEVDVLVFDYLAELTMSVLAAAHARDSAAGWATDFVEVTLRELLPEIVRRGIRVVANAGGVHPAGCARAVRALAAQLGLAVRVAVVEGDDVRALLPRLRDEGGLDLDRGLPLPATLATANAYLGALPIRDALAAGAQIVVTGRCVDSAVTLGTLMAHFGWRVDEHDKLAQGSLAGHIVECGAQGSGGLFTDWEQVPDWAHIGYPVLECHADGHFVVTKPPGTGGLVTPATVAEQIVYEVGDPTRYLLPDVVCDFSAVRLQADGPSRVRVDGARGGPPTPFYKVSATAADGWHCGGQLTVMGHDAVRKARRTGEALIERIGELVTARGFGPFTRTRVEVLGEGAAFPGVAQPAAAWEAVLRVSARHPSREALSIFARELACAGTSFSPGTTGAGGRPAVSPVMRHVGFLMPKAWLQPTMTLDDAPAQAVEVPPGLALPQAQAAGPAAGRDGDPRSDADVHSADALPASTPLVPLMRLAHARSGDKGDLSNIGVLARRPHWVPWLRRVLTAQRVAAHLAHLVAGPVHRHEWPGLHGFNFVCERALDGGGMASLRHDALGKAMAQVLLAMPVPAPPDLDAEGEAAPR